jgi:hypothetical protein
VDGLLLKTRPKNLFQMVHHFRPHCVPQMLLSKRRPQKVVKHET